MPIMQNKISLFLYLCQCPVCRRFHVKIDGMKRTLKCRDCKKKFTYEVIEMKMSDGENESIINGYIFTEVYR